MSKKILVAFFCLFFLVIVIVFIILPDKGSQEIFEVVALPDSTNPQLYLKKMSWGLTSDKQIVAISTNDKHAFDSTSKGDYIYRGLSSFFYRLKGDSLFVYVPEASKLPVEIKSSIKVVQVELDNVAMMNLIQGDNYKKQGLKAF
ncbi:hypothetical protein [Deminuibacter soli]|uniref:Uncharacterized protein n=1 Tax=Deminuibacter soli TaxID=2291815 RepID=A0A3E1ND52_9BACT|nr:hypothetical protein [Deminuibacter soli]RFM25757.1 hypothetical protein DXN05_23275 [Deminuibacter soli]